jgi:hypothetical protein
VSTAVRREPAGGRQRGAEFFNRLHPDRTKKRAIGQLEAMGYRVTLDTAS